MTNYRNFFEQNWILLVTHTETINISGIFDKKIFLNA